MKKAVYMIPAAGALTLALTLGCSHKKTQNDEAMNSAPVTAQPATDVAATNAPTTNMDNTGNMGNAISSPTTDTSPRLASLGAGSTGVSR